MSGVLTLAMIAAAAVIPPANWSFKSIGAGVGSNNPVVIFPTYALGDLLILAGTGGGGTFTQPTGWLTGLTQGSSPRQAFWYRFADGTEGSNIHITGGSSTSQMVAICYTGGTTKDAQSGANTANSVNCMSSPFTMGTANGLIVTVFSIDNTGNVPVSITGTTIRYADRSTGRGLVIADEIQVASGVTTARTAVFGTSGNNCAQAVGFAL